MMKGTSAFLGFVSLSVTKATRKCVNSQAKQLSFDTQVQRRRMQRAENILFIFILVAFLIHGLWLIPIHLGHHHAHSRQRCLLRNDRRIALGDGDVCAALREAVGEVERLTRHCRWAHCRLNMCSDNCEEK
jgi:hypothetical protein